MAGKATPPAARESPVKEVLCAAEGTQADPSVTCPTIRGGQGLRRRGANRPIQLLNPSLDWARGGPFLLSRAWGRSPPSWPRPAVDLLLL